MRNQFLSLKSLRTAASKLSCLLTIVVMLSMQQVSASDSSDFVCAIAGGLVGTCAYKKCDTGGDQALTVTAGDGSPNGSTFPNLDPNAMASAIDKWVVQQNPRTTFKKLGKVIVATAKHSNINPFLMVAIPRMESSMGDPSDFNVQHGNNAYGRTATGSQPHFNGRVMWYKWSSVKASVDYTAPENKNASGGGDMAAYLRNVYGDSLDKGDLTATMMKYAPPAENDTSAYIANLKKWIGELVSLAKSGGGSGGGSAAAATTSDTQSSDDSCQCSIAPPNDDGKPTVVIDPGHGPSKSTIDSSTKLNMVESPGANGEMSHVWNVAKLMKRALSSQYKIILTKNDINENVTFRERASIADDNNAALALSIHGDPTLKHPGEIYVQKVGLYRGSGSNKTTYNDAATAAKSQSFASVFKQQRESVSGSNVTIKDNTFNGRGGGMEPGNIPTVQLFSKTPWVYNEKRMPFDDKDYAKELEASVKKAVPSKVTAAADTSPGATPDSGSCDGTNGSIQDAVNTAMRLAWADGSHGTDQKPAYKAALRTASSKGWYSGGANGNDCGGFVTVVMRLSGADPTYNNKRGGTVEQQAYLDAHPGKYKNLGQVKNTKDLQPGDIAINSGHTFMYVGPQSDHPSFHGDQASASYSADFDNSRAPSAETLGVYSGHFDGPFTFYRLRSTVN